MWKLARLSFIKILRLILMAGCLPAIFACQPESAKPDAQFLAKGFINDHPGLQSLQYQLLAGLSSFSPANQAILVFSERQNDRTSSHLQLWQFEGKTWKLLKQADFEQAYNPRLEYLTEFSGKSMHFGLRLQYGAAAERFILLELSQAEFRFKHDFEAASFVWQWYQQADRSETRLLALDSSATIEQAQIYVWRDAQLIPLAD